MGGVEGHGPLTLGSTDSQAGCLGHMCQSVGHGYFWTIYTQSLQPCQMRTGTGSPYLIAFQAPDKQI